MGGRGRGLEVERGEGEAKGRGVEARGKGGGRGGKESGYDRDQWDGVTIILGFNLDAFTRCKKKSPPFVHVLFNLTLKLKKLN
jgi:hypothetical protein